MSYRPATAGFLSSRSITALDPRGNSEEKRGLHKVYFAGRARFPGQGQIPRGSERVMVVCERTGARDRRLQGVLVFRLASRESFDWTWTFVSRPFPFRNSLFPLSVKILISQLRSPQNRSDDIARPLLFLSFGVDASVRQNKKGGVSEDSNRTKISAADIVDF